MDEDTIRRAAEAAFKRQFGGVGIARINVHPRFDHEDDPVVDVKIIYEGKYEQLNAAGLLRVERELWDEVWADPEEQYRYPVVHFLSRTALGKRDLASV